MENRINSMILYAVICFMVDMITYTSCDGHRTYTNEIVLQLYGGEAAAIEMGRKHNLVFISEVIEDHYLFTSPRIEKRSLMSTRHHVEDLKKDEAVLWFEQQHIKYRYKRDYILEEDAYEKGSSSSNTSKRAIRTQKSAPRDFNDVLYKKQWYLRHGAEGRNDMNVIPAWEKGFSGKNVVVTILDDGIQTDHPDLTDNYDPQASYDINDNDPDPMPQNNANNKHGTRCAGEVASMAFNNYCGVGIAYNAKIGGIRMLDGIVTDAVEARALGHNPQHVDIYSASWGPKDDGTTVDGPGKLATLSFMNGINRGRNGKGSIFVWASGNGGNVKDSCNCDGYTNSIYTLSISSATHSNSKPWYLEQCSSTLATTYSSGRPYEDPFVVTVDMDRTYLDDIKAGRPGDPVSLCTEHHTGTSASAPMAAGMSALALEANPNLTWRDMQHIVVLTSRYQPLSKEAGWFTNGMNRKISHKFGYGLMDGEQMVHYSSTWQTVPPQRKCDSHVDNTERRIPRRFKAAVLSTIYSNGCENSLSEIKHLEHVQATVTLRFRPRGNLLIKLISPMGTHSTLLFPRPNDMKDDEFNNWPFLSVHFWGEIPVGNWTLSITNDGAGNPHSSGILKRWSLTMYGTYENPLQKYSNYTPTPLVPTHYAGPCHSECLSGCFGKASDQCYTCKHYQMEYYPKTCVKSCPLNYYPEHGICKKCHSSCKSCFGPHSNDCQTCEPKYYLKMDEMVCIRECPDGFYTHTELKLCIQCEDRCKTCSISPGHCDNCTNGLVMVEEHHCHSNCPSHSYKMTSSNSCESCSEDCKECSGPSSDECLSCYHGKYLQHGHCVSDCKNHFFADIQDAVCYSCNPLCESCQNGSTCSTCITDFSLIDSQCKANDTCQSKECTCPDNLLLMEDKCLNACVEGYFAEGGICRPCFDNCRQCDGYKANKCTSCKSEFLLHDGKCNPSCPDGYYGSDAICKPCSNSCKTCISENKCVTCPDDQYFDSGMCVPKCPSDYYSTATRQCVKCHHSCRSCSSNGAFACSSCKNGEHSPRGNCVPCAYNKHFDEEKQTCSPCHKMCKTCSGPGTENCDSCLLPYQFEASKHRCLPCCLPNVDSRQTCCVCDPKNGLCTDVHQYFSMYRGKSKQSDSNITNDFELISIAFCILTIVVFFIIFAALQCYSRRCTTHDYAPLPQRSENGINKIEVTSDVFVDDHNNTES